MLPRTQIFSIEPAPLSSKATDLTQGAFGLALEVQCYESVNMRPSNFSEDMEETTENMLQSFLFTAARPDVFLAEAKLRKLPNN